MNDILEKQNVTKHKISPKRYIIIAAVFIPLMIIATLVFIFLTQEQKGDPASETVFRYAAAYHLYNKTNIKKEPNDLNDEDFTKITEMSPIHANGTSGYNFWKDLDTGIYYTELKTRELSDIKLLDKFSNLQKLELDAIKYPANKIPQWMKILSRIGIYDLNERISLDLSPLKNLSKLESLYLSRCQINNIKPLSGLINLTYLELSETGISNVEPLRELTDLQSLSLSHTWVKDLEPIKNLKNLESLNLESTQVSDLEPINGFVNLKFLYLYNTPVSNLEPVKGLARLENLDLNCTQVSDLEPLRNLKNVYNLILSRTRVTNIEPIKDLKSLHYLSLVSTNVSDLEPIRGLTNLRILQIGDTLVSDLEPIKALKQLEYIYMEDCMNITEVQINDLKKALPDLNFWKTEID